MRTIHHTSMVVMLVATSCTAGIRAGADFPPDVDFGPFFETPL